MKRIFVFVVIICNSIFLLGQNTDTVNFHLLNEFVANKDVARHKPADKRLNKMQIDSRGDTLSMYKITKIDSLGDYYLIEATNTKYLYRILSIKSNSYYDYLQKQLVYLDSTNDKEKLEVGKIYQMDLRSMEDGEQRIHIDTTRVGFPLAMAGGSLSDNDTEYYDAYGKWRIKYGLYNEVYNLTGLFLIPPVRTRFVMPKRKTR